MTRNHATRGTLVLVVTASVLMIVFAGLCGKHETQRDRLKADESARESAGKADQEKLRGGWVIVSSVENGEPNLDYRGTFYNFDGGMLYISIPRGPSAVGFQYRVNPTKSPKQIEWGSATSPVRLIYSFKGENTLWLSFNTTDGPRPSDFAAEEGDHRIIHVLNRYRQDVARLHK